MSLNQLVASDRLRPLLEGVVEAMKPAAVSSASDTGTSASLSIAPSIKVKPEVQGAESVRKIVDALISDGGGADAAPIADTISFDGMGLYFVGAGSARDDEINFESNRTDAEAPSLYLNSREGNDTINVKTAPQPFDAPEGGNAPTVTIDAGEGRDKVTVTAGVIDEVNGGEGDDIVTSRGDTTNLVDGGDGNDSISVFGRDIGAVAGGSGDDEIIAYGDIIGSVSGGDGDDQIVVGSRNATFAEGAPEFRNPIIAGGSGDDMIAIAGKAEVAFAKGDGSDQVTVGDTTSFDLTGFELGEIQLTEAEDGTLTISGPEGSGDQISIESRTGTLRYNFDQNANRLTVYTSEDDYAAALSEATANPLADTARVDVAVDEGAQEPTEVVIEKPTFLRLTGDLALTPGTTLEDQSDGTLISFSDEAGKLKLTSSSGPLLIDITSNRTLALFQTQEQYDAWTTSPANPQNRNASSDPLMAVLERINQRFV